MKKKLIEIVLSIVILSFLAGCGERLEEDPAEQIWPSESETDQRDEQVSEEESGEVEDPTAEATVDKEQESAPEEQAQEKSRTEPTEEHDRQMLALLDKACGSKIYTYVSVDMDEDGESEMIGVANDHFSVWYCSSNFEDCYMVSGSFYGYDDCTIEQIELNGERHIVIDVYNMLGDEKSYSILALHDGKIEILVNDNYGYVYMNKKNNDIILDVEAYDGKYDKIYDIWTTHTWTDTYLYYEDGKYKEYGAATLSEKDFLKYDNAQELLDEIEKENQNENVLEIRYSFFIRENGIVIIQCEEEQEEFIAYYHYTFRENGNHLNIEMSRNNGIMYSTLSQLDEVTYP